MFIIWGSSLYGKTDEIEGIGHVATRFGHLYYIPLIPMGSMFVTGQESESYFGASVPLNLKSIGLAWARTLSILAGIVALVVGGGVLTDPMIPSFDKALAGAFIIASIIMILVLRMNWTMKASYERAKDLSKLLDFDPRLDVFIDLHYEQINEMEADRRMDDLNSALDDLDDLDDEIEASGMNQRFDMN